MVSCISASWMNMPICLHTGKQLAFVFFVYCKNKIPANLLENLNKMFFYFIFPFLKRKTKHCTLSCTFHYAGHTKAQQQQQQQAVIDPSAALRAH